MLQITVPAREDWDEASNTFITSKETTLQLEHSLVSISKWESKWCKPFLTNSARTNEEMLDYIRCMTLTKNVQEEVYLNLTQENISDVVKYIQAPMTATWFNDVEKGSNKGEQPTSELIYYWMVALNIPFECQKWHLNRLLTLIKVCNLKNQPPKKMRKRDILTRNAALNEARRKAMKSKG